MRKIRGKKYIFPASEQKRILEYFKKYIHRYILPDKNIEVVIASGTLKTGKMGKYSKFQILPMYRRLYSDIDLGMFVKNKFKPKKHWKFPSKYKNAEIYWITKFEKKFPVICWMIKPRYWKKYGFSNGKLERKMFVLYKK